MILIGRFIQCICVALLTGGVFAGLNRDYTLIDNWRAVSGFCYIAIGGAYFVEMVSVTSVFHSEREIFLKEESSKLYSANAYFLSRCLIDLPLIFIFPVLMLGPAYWIAGMAPTAYQFLIFCLICVIGALSGNSLGLLIGSIIEDARSARTVINLFNIPICLFSGFFKNRANYPVWLGWV